MITNGSTDPNRVDKSPFSLNEKLKWSRFWFFRETKEPYGKEECSLFILVEIIFNWLRRGLRRETFEGTNLLLSIIEVFVVEGTLKKRLGPLERTLKKN